MDFTVSGRCQPIERFKDFIKTSLLFISAFNRDLFYGVVGFDQSLRGAFEALADDISVDSGMDQMVEAELQLFAVDGELTAEVLDAMLLIKVVVEVLPDLFNLAILCISHFHENWVDKGSRWAGFSE